MTESTFDGMPEPTGPPETVTVPPLNTDLYVRNEHGQFAQPWTGLPALPSDDDLAFLADYMGRFGWVCMTTEQAARLTERKAVRHRTPDHSTSVAGAVHVQPRAGTQRAALLAAYGNDLRMAPGYTDEEAARHVGLLDSCYWKRCGELRDAGWIEETGVVRDGSAGTPRIVCRITDAGRAMYQAILEASRDAR